MKNFSKKQTILAFLTLALGLGLVGCGKRSAPVINVNVGQNQNVSANTKSTTTTFATSTAEINTTVTTTTYVIDSRELLTYKSNYGFEVKYLKSYKNDNKYKIWVSREGAVNLLEQWGVNEFQETVFGITVYSEVYKNKVLSYYQYYPTGEKIKLGNYIIAEKLDIKYPEKSVSANSLIIEKGDYIYIVYSSFMNMPQNSEANKEFRFILDNLEFY